MDKTEIASDLFLHGYNCAQAVFATFAEDYGMDREMALKVADPLGGGVRCGEICGAVTGAALVIGLRYGHSDPEDTESKERCISETKEFRQRFLNYNGNIVCRDILGVDVCEDDGRKFALEHNLFHTVCVDMVKSAVEILEDMDY